MLVVKLAVADRSCAISTTAIGRGTGEITGLHWPCAPAFRDATSASIRLQKRLGRTGANGRAP
jgi:hypothetical protein